MLTIELLQRARRIIFVRLSTHEFLCVVALRGSIEVSWWVVGVGHPIQSHRIEQGAEALGLFDGYAWNIERLEWWIRRHCPVCWNVLASSRQIYDAQKCKQKAYRQRRKLMPIKLVVTEQEVILNPETDRHARIALLAYAASVDFENPKLAFDLRKRVDELTKAKPIRSFEGMNVGDIPDWLIEQSRGRKTDNGDDK